MKSRFEVSPVAATDKLERSASEGEQLHGDRFEVIMGSDIVRDGMFLELRDRLSGELAVEVFFSDVDGSFATTHYRANVPPDVVGWLQEQARRRLPPAPDDAPGTLG
jgi:hypothetical protein